MRIHLFRIRKENFTKCLLRLPLLVVLVQGFLPDVPNGEPGGQGVILKRRVPDPDRAETQIRFLKLGRNRIRYSKLGRIRIRPDHQGLKSL